MLFAHSLGICWKLRVKLRVIKVCDADQSHGLPREFCENNEVLGECDENVAPKHLKILCRNNRLYLRKTQVVQYTVSFMWKHIFFSLFINFQISISRSIKVLAHN